MSHDQRHFVTSHLSSFSPTNERNSHTIYQVLFWWSRHMAKASFILPWPKKIETTARTWHRRVICRACTCTRLCLACVPVSIFLARVVPHAWVTNTKSKCSHLATPECSNVQYATGLYRLKLIFVPRLVFNSRTICT